MKKLDRRTFAIISHPDAGKTTLTEKLLLQGGAIHIAGEVKARGARRHAHSDWLEMEQQRGISITSSVMTFEYGGLTFNLLDTPGHQDFSEDTYRTLTAVDSAIMVIDAAKGIEAQTLKLFEVCRLRNIPIITYINKMDREARDPFEILEEIEQKLALETLPFNWPVGNGRDFKGCYHLDERVFSVFTPPGEEKTTDFIPVADVSDPTLDSVLSAEQKKNLAEEVELLRLEKGAFSHTAFLEGHLTPVIFGSALRNFGVKDLIESLKQYAPLPNTFKTDSRDIEPSEEKVSGFIFKVQANMDPNHRDRVAFFRLCSGRFERGMKLFHVRSGKQMAIQSPVFFLAQERSVTEHAYPGDILGIPNHGKLRIGDTLTEGETLNFIGIPSFAPEIFMRVYLEDPLGSKKMRKALEDLAEEGVSQLFKPISGGAWVIGVVGQLQLDVLKSRIELEYRVPIRFEAAPIFTARWLQSSDPIILENFINRHQIQIAHDINNSPVYLSRNKWDLEKQVEDQPKITFAATREQHPAGKA